MRRISLIFLIPVFLLVSGCSALDLAGIADRIKVSVSRDFTGISVLGCIDVIFTDDCETAQIEADVNLLPYVEVYEVGKLLKIEFSEGLKVTDGNFRATVLIPFKSGVSNISVSGTASFVSDFPISGKDIAITASGSSEIICPLHADRSATVNLNGASSAECGSLSAALLNLSLSGASVLEAAGRVSSCQLFLVGASELRGLSESQNHSVEIGSCYGDLTGASKAFFRSDGLISCNLYGDSYISYIGKADISGSKCYDDSEIEEED